MFIYNLKINGTKVFKIFFTFIVILVICILGICVFRIFNGAGENFVVADDVDKTKTFKIDDDNYTNVLKSVCDNIDDYVGMKINYVGYVYRVNDLAENQFILARNMTISNDNKYVVVGFLCECENIKSYGNNTWVEVTGEIQKGAYHGTDIPILKIDGITTVEKPQNVFVPPPSDDYIPTSNML